MVTASSPGGTVKKYTDTGTGTITHGAGDDTILGDNRPQAHAKNSTGQTVSVDLANSGKLTAADVVKQGTTGTGLGTTGTGSGGGGGGGGGSTSSTPAKKKGDTVTSFKRNDYEAPELQSATSQEDYIRSMYDANRTAEEARLQAAYEENMNTLAHEQEKIDPQYEAAVNQANAQAAINRANFNEMAAASGLNTGAGSQARLSQNNALLNNVSAIRKAQADAQAELEFQRGQMEIQYKNAINEALSKNDLALAQALYQEAVRVDESLVATAAQQAQLDFNAWNANENMRYNLWNTKNQLNWNTWNRLYKG